MHDDLLLAEELHIFQPHSLTLSSPMLSMFGLLFEERVWVMLFCLKHSLATSLNLPRDTWTQLAEIPQFVHSNC